MWGTLLKVGLGLLAGGVAAAAVVGIAGLVYHVVQERITRQNAARLVRQCLDSGNYTEVHVGLTEMEVVDIDEEDGEAYVAIEVNGEKIGLRSSYGTSLSEGDVLTL